MLNSILISLLSLNAYGATRPTLNCDLILRPKTGPALSKSLSLEIADEPITLQDRFGFDGRNTTLYVTVDRPTRFIDIVVLDDETTQRHIVHSGHYLPGEGVLAYVDHGPKNGEDSIDVICTVKEEQ